LCVIVDSFGEPVEQKLANINQLTVAVSGRKRGVESQLIALQEQTLDSVRELVSIERERLQLTKEMVAMKKAKLMLQGCMQDADGNWVAFIAPAADATQLPPASEE